MKANAYLFGEYINGSCRQHKPIKMRKKAWPKCDLNTKKQERKGVIFNKKSCCAFANLI
ncbi:hypothetical protein GO988_16410 [Hymenobacter sp. HMF4947]|uniref:Uncharacterized protein n=1 Tax=Hymenobacter ginkgonis TaxID=2682976 RepID=A0A7K1THN7_9BACT|nr:hypothetical protein [Hymenobacter ginkgonis]MVN77914.1 hypothetical protein [Hymenobacter ginkgonis]